MTAALVKPPSSVGIRRSTPLEYDVQLQAAELVFRTMMEGKRVQMCDNHDLEDWYTEACGPEWVKQNEEQRAVIQQQMKDEGEKTPMWIEALAHMGDIAWEVFEASDRGEVVRNMDGIDRAEIVEQFKDLFPKVQSSYFARCGAGDQLYGLRACIAILRLFTADAEVIGLCASCLRLIISDNVYNRDGLVRISVPMPPDARGSLHRDMGWSFLRAALEAFLAQSRAALAKGNESLRSHRVAAKVAQCIVEAAPSPAFIAQLEKLQDPVSQTVCADHAELRALLPDCIANLKKLSTAGPEADPSVKGELQRLLELLTAKGDGK